jgi:hypothetical protein
MVHSRIDEDLRPKINPHEEQNYGLEFKFYIAVDFKIMPKTQGHKNWPGQFTNTYSMGLGDQVTY